MDALPVQYIPAFSRAVSRLVRSTAGFVPAMAKALTGCGVPHEESVCFVFACLLDDVLVRGSIADPFPWFLTDRASTLAFVLSFSREAVYAFVELYGKEDIVYASVVTAFLDWESRGWKYSEFRPDPGDASCS